MRSDGKSLTLSARELLQLWGARRRTWAVVRQIAEDMRRFDLQIDPPLVDIPLDEKVTISPAAQHRKSTSTDANPKSVETESDPEKGAPPDDRPQVRIKMFWIPAANNGVEQINPTEPISVATSRMMRFDYSQLAVMTSSRAGAQGNLLGIGRKSAARRHRRRDDGRRCIRRCRVRELG